MERRHFITTLGFGLGCIYFSNFLLGQNKRYNALPFKDGDRVCFIGDSITHHGAWQAFIFNYYLTRFPNSHIQYFNCGYSGGNTPNAIHRFETDVKPLNPSAAVIMLGMNDVSRHLYKTGKEGEEVVRQRDQDFIDYKTDIEKLILKLKGINCENIILVKPSMYDQYASLETENLVGVNDVLLKFGNILEDLSKTYQVKWVDFTKAMTTTSTLLQVKDPTFSFAPNDRIHPNELGHQFMAYEFLKSFDLPDLISSLSIDAKAKSITKVINAEASNISISKRSISFDIIEESLPYPIKNSVSEINDIVELDDRFNQQLIQVLNLKEGIWELRIDNSPIGVYSSKQLSNGINIGSNKDTPQSMQAHEVLAANMEYYTLITHYRDYISINSLMERNSVNWENDQEIKDFFEEFPYNGGKHATGYFNRIFGEYWDFRKELDSYEEKASKMFKNIYRLNQPVHHQYHLRKL